MKTTPLFKSTCSKEASPRFLIGFGEFLAMLDLQNVRLWGFRKMNLFYSAPFGLELVGFESASKKLSLGVVVSDTDFRSFLKAEDYQIIDGLIDVYTDEFGFTPAMTIECFDASEWIVSTEHETVANYLKGCGFKPDP